MTLRRPIQFPVDANVWVHFREPELGSRRGILQEFNEAGVVIIDGENVCLFPYAGVLEVTSKSRAALDTEAVQAIRKIYDRWNLDHLDPGTRYGKDEARNALWDLMGDKDYIEFLQHRQATGYASADIDDRQLRRDADELERWFAL